uniref:C2H2-type domain-containing protein n=1 Tax=Globodera pallida TaxID=36090 RepID=A0A183BYW7_GLOPA
MASDDIKELKAITLQILKNQTLMIAHLVNQAQAQQPQLKLKQVKTEPREPSSTMAKRKAPEPPAVEPLKDLSNNKNNGGVVSKRRRSSAPTVESATKPTKFCSVCMVIVKEDNLMNHIWEHIQKKVMKEKGTDSTSAYSFVCDVNGCHFRTNKLDLAGEHANKHPDVERNKVVLDNRENSEPLFLATLAQCYDRMTDVEKDEVYRKRYD